MRTQPPLTPASLALKHAAPSLSYHTLQPAPAIPTAAPPNTAPRAHSVSRLSLPPLPLQLHNGYVYASAHVRDVDGRDVIQDGDTPVDIDGGFEVAPGDASDVEVANAHAWGSSGLIFSDGAFAKSALNIAEVPSYRGKASYVCK
jgi:hypothetical protein